MSDRALHRLLILAAVLAAFSPALTAGFVGWDDRPFILENPMIGGLGLSHLRAMAGSVLGGVWMPLSWLSLALDRAIWGFEPGGYHLTSLLLHAAAALLFHEACRKLFPRNEWAATLAALFFALHPLRVESVAWAAERKGVLAGALIAGSLYARLRSFESARARAWAAAALAAYALSLAAKPNGLTYPLALLALEAGWLRRKPAFSDFAPYFALSAAAFGTTILALRAAGGMDGAAAPAAGKALFGLCFYPWKTLWPSGLSPYYPPRPWFGSWSWEFAGCALAAAGAAMALRGRRPAAVAAACYGLLILPMLGLVSHGVPHSAADRFSYLPAMPLAVMFGAAFGGAPARRALAAVWLAALGVSTWSQCEVWRDPVSLWTRASELQPSALGEGNLGAALVNAGRAEEGVARLRASIALDPALPIPHEALGAALSREGRHAEARAAWREGLAAAPSPELSAFLGASLTKDDITTGTALLRAAVLARPDKAAWRADLGDALALAGRRVAARTQYDAALGLDPSLGRAHNNLGLLVEREGRAEEAAAHYRAALRDPAARAEAHHNLGDVRLAERREAEAERHFREALRLNPALAESAVNLGNLLARRRDYARAAALYRSALKASPRSVEARANLSAVAPFLRK